MIDSPPEIDDYWERVPVVNGQYLISENGRFDLGQVRKAAKHWWVTWGEAYFEETVRLDSRKFRDCWFLLLKKD